MLLIKIRDYILQQQEVTLTELSTHFQMPESAIEKMADLWQGKSQIEKIQKPCDYLDAPFGCSDCATGCAIKNTPKIPKKSLILYRVLSS